MNGMIHSLARGKVVLPILLSALLVLVLTGLVMFYIKGENVEQVGVNKAKALADLIAAQRTFYTAGVVARAKAAGMRINYDWEEVPGTLPLPATFVRAMGQEIQKNFPDTRIRLYSRYPFPHRKNTETYDEFELRALDALEQDPRTPYYGFEEVNGKLSVRYAVADLMRPACVGCHNSHPETPRTGWKVGDVRGVVEIITPVDDVEKGLQFGTFVLMSVVTLGMGLVVTVSHFSIKRPIHDVVNLLSSTSAQIAATVEQQERAAMDQAAAVNETTTTMDELRVSSGRAAEQSEVAATGAQKAAGLGEEGAKKIQHTLDGMAGVKEKVGAIADKILRLSEQTGQIGNITKLVSDIAIQTNMLALNAAVEAARAGEHGKGFAVVAGEIRKLADQSKASAEKIHAHVEEIQRTTNSAVMVTEEGTKMVDQGMQLAQEAAGAFTGVKTTVASSYRSSQQISLNVKQQASAINQVVEAMNNLQAGARETADGLSQTKIGVQTVKEAAQRLKGMV